MAGFATETIVVSTRIMKKPMTSAQRAGHGFCGPFVFSDVGRGSSIGIAGGGCRGVRSGLGHCRAAFRSVRDSVRRGARGAPQGKSSALEARDQRVEPAEVCGEQDALAFDLEEELLGHPRARRPPRGRRCSSIWAAASAARRVRSRPTTSSRSRLCASASAMRNSAGRSMRDSSRRTQSTTASRPGVGQRVRRALGTVAVAVDADLGEEAGPLEAADRVVQRAVGDRHQAVVAALSASAASSRRDACRPRAAARGSSRPGA